MMFKCGYHATYPVLQTALAGLKVDMGYLEDDINTSNVLDLGSKPTVTAGVS
jgi:hypothetical protein